MTINYGTGVSRVLDPTGTQYTEVILQQGKPPLDAEFNLLQDIAQLQGRTIVQRGVPSGFLGNGTNQRADFITSPTYSNWFKFGPQRTGEQQAFMWACVNGWQIPVWGTETGTPPGSPDNTDTYNVIALNPPPSNAGDFRIDFAYLEVWLARVPPNPSTLNKPASASIYSYGNIEGGMSYLADDIIDPAIGFETSERVQLQYAIRIASGLVGLTTNPDGFDPSVVKAQAAATSPTSYIFQNMRQTLGDPGLWRAGDGTQNALGTVDGYSYAIPICAVFRRNSVAWNGDPAQNLNGGFNRNPTAVTSANIATFSTVVALAATLSPTATVATIVSSSNIPLPISPATPVLIQIGDELMTYTAVTTGSPPQITGLVRGVNGSRADQHVAGTVVTVVSGRPDGLFSDQVALTDILDLRHTVNPNGFDYTALLKGNLDNLLRGQLRANWKRTGAGPQGPFCFYQDKITTGSVSLGVTKLDAFDGIRQIYSDAATLQRVICVCQANSASLPANVTGTGFQINITANQNIRATNGFFSPGDQLQIPVAQLKTGLAAGDSDQVRWVFDLDNAAVAIRLDGQSVPLNPTLYTVTGSTTVGGGVTNVTPQFSGQKASISSFVGTTVTLTGLSGVTAAAVGQTITISGAATVANNGTFPITAVLSPTSVTYTNASGVAPDANNGVISWFTSTIQVQTATPHKLQNGQIVVISGVVGVTAANATWTITVVDATHFTLNGSTFSGAYTSGGIVLGPNLTPNDDIIITFGPNFPTINSTAANGPGQLYITLNIMYGPGRGLSRRPDSLHSIAFINPATDLMVRPMGVPSADQQTSVAWAPLWQRYRSGTYKNNVPVQAECFGDLGSKTVIVSPFRRITQASTFTSMDGTAVNPYVTTPVSGVGFSTSPTTFQDPLANFLAAGISFGDTLILQGPDPGRFLIQGVTGTTLTVVAAVPLPPGPGPNIPYTIEHLLALVVGTNGQANNTTTFTDLTVNFGAAGVVPGDQLYVRGSFAATYTVLLVGLTSLTVERTIFTGSGPITGVNYTVTHAQGLMPTNAANGTSSKWTTTDPLSLFSGSQQSLGNAANTKNIYVTLPRTLAPGWGAFYIPILWEDASPFAQGINFMSLSVEGSTYSDGDRNYVPYSIGGGTFSAAVFSTLNFGPPITPAVYNTAFGPANSLCGMQKFTDFRGQGRQGLQLPPFYGIARLFAVYEAHDYNTNGSAYNSTTRVPKGTGATNLLRQNMGPNDGPTLWVEIDADGDSTFILNANAIDITRSPNPIASFAAGDYVIESSIFGFDRGSFDLTKEFRLVMTNPDGVNGGGTGLNRKQANDNGAPTGLQPGGGRYSTGSSTGPNVGAHVTGPTCVLLGPATQSDQLVINYSRTPYQGDAWGSQTNYIDISQNVGPLQTGTAYQLVSTKLQQNSLTRPNQKIFEVLGSVGFATTLGTGRLSGDASTNPLSIRDVGFQDPSAYPPTSPVQPRPVTLTGNFFNDTTEVATEYLGASERLPLGALFRDADFRGGLLGSTTMAPLVYSGDTGVATPAANLAVNTALEQSEILLDTSTAASGAPSDLITHVDGEQNNYSLVVNFRTLRGGSVFTAGGGHPGGEVIVQEPSVTAPDAHTNVIVGRAYLVRNYTTSVGANEVSPGGELMMLIVTNVERLTDPFTHPGFINVGTNGTGEGYAAADFYRIDGHPMLRDNVRLLVDPTQIALSPRST